MTIEKAIKILEGELRYYNEIAQPDVIKAHILGIEALKLIKSQYDPDHQMMRRPLPSETEE